MSHRKGKAQVYGPAAWAETAVEIKTPQRSSGLQREGKVLGKHGLLWLVCPRLLWTCCTQVLYLLS